MTGRVYTILQAPASWEMDVNLATAATAVAAAFTCVYLCVERRGTGRECCIKTVVLERSFASSPPRLEAWPVLSFLI